MMKGIKNKNKTSVAVMNPGGAILLYNLRI